MLLSYKISEYPTGGLIHVSHEYPVLLNSTTNAKMDPTFHLVCNLSSVATQLFNHFLFLIF